MAEHIDPEMDPNLPGSGAHGEDDAPSPTSPPPGDKRWSAPFDPAADATDFPLAGAFQTTGDEGDDPDGIATPDSPEARPPRRSRPPGPAFDPSADATDFPLAGAFQPQQPSDDVAAPVDPPEETPEPAPDDPYARFRSPDSYSTPGTAPSRADAPAPSTPDPLWPAPWSQPAEPAPPSVRETDTWERPASRIGTERPRRRWPTIALGIASGILGALATVTMLWALGVFDEEPVDQSATTAPPTTVIERVVTEVINPETEGSSVAAAVGRKVIPSIVTVELGAETATGFNVAGSGSGVVLTSDGLIVTNEHVISDSEGLTGRIVLSDGRVFPFELVGADALTDLAVLQIPTSGLTAIELGSTRSLVVGDPAIAVGNPLGLEGGPSLTVGVISAFNRQVNPSFDASDRLFGMLQTDAPFTNGSSGGALVDGEGRLIGITTAVGVAEAGSGDVGFATPVELMTRITDEIIETGDVRHAFLGITGRDQLDRLDDGSLKPAGAVVITAEPDTAASEFGLEPGDVITRFNGTEVRTMQDLVIGLRHYRVGEPVEFEVLRDGAVQTLIIELGERPEGL